ncbi:hypothetical protein BC829DRAFT_397229 [Chytridium lagenaria]|nr:hypothetical protein BC829DRAFT_397229 [Chytridium lagenaria]
MILLNVMLIVAGAITSISSSSRFNSRYPPFPIPGPVSNPAVVEAVTGAADSEWVEEEERMWEGLADSAAEARTELGCYGP